MLKVCLRGIMARRRLDIPFLFPGNIALRGANNYCQIIRMVLINSPTPAGVKKGLANACRRQRASQRLPASAKG